MKQNLNEEILRIKKLFNINESSVIEEQGNPLLMDVIKKMIPKLETKFVSAIESKLNKKIATATDNEISSALKSVEMTALRKEIAQAIYNAEKTMIDDVFSRYNMSIAGEASAAYRELQTKGINKSLLKDIASEWKVGKSSTASTRTVAPSTTSFTIPNIVVPKLSDIWKLDSIATKAKLDNLFPNAAKSDIDRMVNNLEKMKLTNQVEFEKELQQAVVAFNPKYAKHIQNPTEWEYFKNFYNSLSWFWKTLFWAVAAVGVDKFMGLISFISGYDISLGKAVSWLTSAIKNVFKDVIKGGVEGLNSNSQTEPEQQQNSDRERAEKIKIKRSNINNY